MEFFKISYNTITENMLLYVVVVKKAFKLNRIRKERIRKENQVPLFMDSYFLVVHLVAFELFARTYMSLCVKWRVCIGNEKIMAAANGQLIPASFKVSKYPGRVL